MCHPKGGRKHPEQSLVQIDTSQILFICGGAFEGIDRIISSRIALRTIGYGAESIKTLDDGSSLYRYLQPNDLRRFGLIPEIIGRLPVITHLNPLDEKALRRILTEPKNSIIKQYQKMFRLEGKELTFDPAVYDLIVRKAVELKLGARGLRSMIEAIMLDVMFEMPDSEETIYHITADMVESQLSDPNFQNYKAA